MKGPTATPEKASLDFTVIEQPLDSLLSALEHKIEREWPRHLASVRGGRELFLLTLRTAVVTYRSVRWLCADKPPDPQRKLEYCISVPPLNRTILDNLFTVVFILEDLPARCDWYSKADWRETRLELERYTAEYGHLPEWRDWLTRLTAYSDAGIAILAILPTEVATPTLIPSWPNPGAMIKHGISKKSALPPTRAFLKYLNDWFYADLSQQAHLGGSGLMKRAGVLINDYPWDSAIEQKLKRYKYSQVGQTVALVLALASELETHFHFGLGERAKYLWLVVSPCIPVAKELCDKRYASLLGMSASSPTMV